MQQFFLSQNHSNIDELELTQDKAIACLDLITADCCYDQWFQILSALKSLDLSEDKARKWSQGSEKFKESSFRSNWKAAKDTDATDRAIGYLVKLSSLDASEWTKQYLREHGKSSGNCRGQRSKTIPERKAAKPKINAPVTDENFKIELVSPTPLPIPHKVNTAYGYDLNYLYSYSDTQEVRRTEYYNNEGDRIIPPGKDKDKSVFPYTNGKKRKDGKVWPAYRLDDALATETKYLLVAEGEKCVDALWGLGFPAITFQGGWVQEEVKQAITIIKDLGITLIFLPDHDKAGRDKVNKAVKLCSEAEVDYTIFDLSTIWDKIPETGDIVDWVTNMEKQGLTSEEIGRELAEYLEASLAAGYLPEWLDLQEEYYEMPNGEHSDTKKNPSSDYADLPPHERLKLDIQAYLATSDIFNKTVIKGNICSTYRIKEKEFNLLCETLEKQHSTPKKTVFSFDEFLELGTEGLTWVIPGLLPVGETILLAAQAKTGKTLLTTDIAYSVLSGDRCIGEVPGVTGKVLLISSDESPNSTKRRLKARGFDLLPNANENLRIMTHLDLSKLTELEAELEDFKPQLVIIDSLTSISRDLGVSENDAEYAKGIYRLKEVIGRYQASGILIHHENKNKDAQGLAKVAGSARIVAATWGIAQLVAAKPDDDNCPQRWLKIKPREGEAVTLSLEINPKDTWAAHGIFDFLGEFGDENGEKRTHGERVLDLLKKFSPKGLEFKEIDSYLNVGRSLYTILDRLEDRQLITKRRSTVNKRRWVYALPKCTTKNNHVTESLPDSTGDSPPPTVSLSESVKSSETFIESEIEVSQHLVNSNSTVSQHPQNSLEVLNSQNPEPIQVLENSNLSQHLPKTEGERGSDESVDLKKVVQDTENREENNGTELNQQQTLAEGILEAFRQVLTIPREEQCEALEAVRFCSFDKIHYQEAWNELTSEEKEALRPVFKEISSNLNPS